MLNKTEVSLLFVKNVPHKLHKMQTYTEINGNKKAILFFNGWGMDQHPFRHLSHNGYDFIMFYDYSTLHFSNCPVSGICEEGCMDECIMQQIFSRYREIYIIGWGFGVWCASAAFDKYLIRLGHLGHFHELKFWAKIKRAIAINGTLIPISRTWGITPQSYDKTVAGLPDNTIMEKFLHHMCHTKKEYDFYMANAPQRDASQAKEELVTIKENLFLSNSLTWDTAIIGDNDIIFKTPRQKLFWENYSNISDGYIPGTRRRFRHRVVEIPGSHYLFNKFTSWEELIAL